MTITHIIKIDNKAYILNETAYVITTDDEHYTDAEILEHNAELDIWNEDTIKEGTENEHYTAEEIYAHNEELDIWDISTIKAEAMIDDDETTVIYVPIDSANDYKELNPDLNIVGYNYNSHEISEPEYYDYAKIICSTETNPEMMSVLYERGLCANENYMTLAEAKTCTNDDIDLLLRSNTTVKSFDEFKYFTGVTEIYERFAQGATELVSITLPNTVTSIGKLAFGFGSNDAGASKLETVNGVENVESLGAGVFQNAKKLISLNFTQKLKTIGQAAFIGCQLLESVGDVSGVEGNLANSEFYDCQHLKSLNFSSKLTGTLDRTFYNCQRLGSVGDMSNITAISGAFNRCYWLKKLNLSKKCTSIKSYAFFYCRRLTDLGDLSGVTTLGDNSNCAFGYNYYFQQQELHFPKVTTLNKAVFRLNGEEGVSYHYYLDTLKLYFYKSYDEMTKKGKIVSNQSGKTSAVNLKIYFNGVEATQEQYATLI